MDTGFVPAIYKPPFKAVITSIEGAGLSAADLKCDAASLELALANYSTLLSFKPLLYLTLTTMDALDDAAGLEEPPATVGSASRPTSAALLVACLMTSIGLPHRSLALVSVVALTVLLAVA
jgi:hypothetical protein